jgi:hypothetical protein
MLEVVEIVTYAALTTWLFWVLLKADEHHLPPEQLARAWTTTSKLAVIGCALLGVGFFFHLGVVVHFVRTRRSARGLLLGIAWAAALFGVGIGVISLIDWVANR